MASVSYSTYRSTVDQLHKSVSKATESNKKKRRKIEIEESSRMALVADPSTLCRGIEGRALVAEWNWLLSDRLMIFPRDEDICQGVYHGRYEVSYLEGIIPFAKEFIINFPKSLRINGYSLPSVLVMFYEGDRYAAYNTQRILDHLGIPDIEEYAVADPRPGLMIEVFYRAFDPTHKKWATHRFSSSWNEFLGMLETNNPNHFVEIARDDRRLAGEMATEGTELELQFILNKFVSSLLVYAQATQNKCFLDGMPGEHLNRAQIDQAFSKAGVKSVRLASTDTDGGVTRTITVGQHYRSWHIRQLRDDRYYQNDYKDYPPGSRLVFVKDSVVNSEMSPKTLVRPD
jgi:hypothetical protein